MNNCDFNLAALCKYSGTDDRRADALAAGKKRSAKDRLGVRKGGGGGHGHGMHRHNDVVTGKEE